MRIVLRHTVTLCLLMMVAVTSVQLAAARGQAPAAGMIEICTGTGPVHILVDEDGNPTGGVMICPDYALAFYGGFDAKTPHSLRVDVWHSLWRSDTEALAADKAAPLSQPRGPPVFL